MSVDKTRGGAQTKTFDGKFLVAGKFPVARANKKTPEKVFFYYAVRASGLEPKKGVGETFVSPWRKTASNRALETVGF